MPTNFPTALDDFVNPEPKDRTDSPKVPHAEQHSNINDAVEALQAKVGIDNSLDSASHDFLIAERVVGPASSTDNAIARYDGVTGKLVQNSNASIDDFGNLTAARFIGTFTEGSIPFSGSSGELLEDNANLFYNDIDDTLQVNKIAMNEASSTGNASLLIERGNPTIAAGGSTNEAINAICANSGTGNIRAAYVEAENNNSSQNSNACQGLNAIARYTGSGDYIGTNLRAGRYELRIDSSAIISGGEAIECIPINIIAGSPTVGEGRAILIRSPIVGSASIDALYGLKVQDITGATTNKAIETGAGVVEFGDTLITNGRRVKAYSPINTMTAAVGLTITHPIMRVKGDTVGTIGIAATPSITNPIDGEVLVIQGTSDTNKVTFQSENILPGSKLMLTNGLSMTLGKGDKLILTYDATDGFWYEDSRSDN